MNPKTIELIIRGRSDDDAVLEAVDEEWEVHCAEYCAYFATIQHRLPPGLKRIVDSYYLHDAKVHGIGRKEGRIIFYLQLDTPPESLLTFRYDLIEPPKIERDTLPECMRGKSLIVEWDQDEVELVEGEPPTWRQSILLSNGWLIDLHFRDVEVEEIEAILPVPQPSSWCPATELAETA